MKMAFGTILLTYFETGIGGRATVREAYVSVHHFLRG